MSDLTDPAYFRHVRSEIESLLPDKPSRILEIGSGAGATLAWLKRRWPNAETVAIEGQEALRPILERNADRAFIADLEAGLPDVGCFDLILALDVLEHLRTPERTLEQLAAMLTPNGSIIVSVPNVAHYTVLRPLLLRRRFDYHDAGIMDRTHLRFFTERSALAMMRGAGLTVVDGTVNGLTNKKARLLNAATLGLAKHYLVEQYIMRGDLSGDGDFAWRWKRPAPSAVPALGRV